MSIEPEKRQCLKCKRWFSDTSGLTWCLWCDIGHTIEQPWFDGNVERMKRIRCQEQQYLDHGGWWSK